MVTGSLVTKQTASRVKLSLIKQPLFRALKSKLARVRARLAKPTSKVFTFSGASPLLSPKDKTKGSAWARTDAKGLVRPAAKRGHGPLESSTAERNWRRRLQGTGASPNKWW